VTKAAVYGFVACNGIAAGYGVAAFAGEPVDPVQAAGIVMGAFLIKTAYSVQTEDRKCSGMT